MFNGKEDVLSAESLDLFKLDHFLTDEQRTVRDRVRQYVETVIRPNINPYWEKAEWPRDLAMGLKDLGIIGGVIRGYGSAGLDPLVMCLVKF